MTTLILAEKPSTAQKIASALGTASLKKQAGISWFELPGKGIIVASAVGHLYGLASAKRGYPVFEVEWKPTFEISKNSAFAKKYFTVLKKLAKRCNEFIVATDYDIEGEVIGLNVVRFICNQKDAQRMKFSTLTKDDLIEAYKDRARTLDWGQARAGETRHALDWFYGINLSKAVVSAVSQAENRYIQLSIGRVQGPALALLAERENEIRKFKPSAYWQIFADVKLKTGVFEAIHAEDKFWDESKAKAIFRKVRDKPAEVEDIRKARQAVLPPVPFDLTSLQIEAYRCFRISPKRTLSAAQELYTNALISYPRTSSQKLPQKLGFKKILGRLAKNSKYTKTANQVLKTKLVPREGGKTDPAHPCFSGKSEIIASDSRKIRIKQLEKYVSSWKFNSEKKSYSAKVIRPLQILAYDNKTKQIVSSKVTKVWKTPTDSNKILRIYLENGEQIETTPNHLFYTMNENFDFTSASNLKGGQYLAYHQIKLKQKRKIITEKEFINTYTKEQQKRIKGWFSENRQRLKPAEAHTIDNLRKLNLLPLYSNSENAVVLARLLGFIFGDGHINYHKTKNRSDYPQCCFTARKEDLEQIRRDIRKLGINVKRKLVESNKYVSTLWVKHAILSRLLIALGAPCGNKVMQAFSVPKWILNGNAQVKRAFLSAYFGCEMSIPRAHYRNKRDIKTPSVSIDKIEDKLSLGALFYKQIKKILERDFSIQSSAIKIRERKRGKKYNKPTFCISFTINNNRDNLIRFFSQVGYSYCNYKKEAARRAIAYLLYRNYLILNRRYKRKKAFQLRKQGLPYLRISSELDIPATTIRGWINFNKSIKEEHTPMNLPVFKDFNLEAGEENWFKIIKIEEIKAPEYVYDVEVEKYHTFFINGFLVHNCIYPTGDFARGLAGDSAKIYDLIVKRFFSVFGEPGEREGTQVKFSIEKELFLMNGIRTTKLGWQEWYMPYSIKKELELPTLKPGEIYSEKSRFKKDETKPPARYTPASIIKQLEKENLGTKATRSNIIEILRERGYIQGTPIEVTELGRRIVDTFGKYAPQILSKELTRKFEEEMEKVQENRKKPDTVLSEARKVITEICRDFDANKDKIGKVLGEAFTETEKQKNTLCKCPKCEKGSIKVIKSRKSGKFFAACDGYPKCMNTFPLPQSGKIYKTKQTCNECGFPILKILRYKRKPYEMCLNHKCKSKEAWGKSD